MVGTDISDPWIANPDHNVTPTFAPQVDPDNNAYYQYGQNSIAVPKDQFIYSQYWGPTFKFESTSTPAPGAALSALFGLPALLRRRRR